MKILIINGLNLSATELIHSRVASLVPEANIVTCIPDYSDCSPMDVVNQYKAEDDWDVIMGNDFGGFLAYVIGAKLGIKTLLTDPYIPTSDYIVELIGLHRYTDDLNELWDTYQLQNNDCSILLDAKLDIPDTQKIFERLGETAHISICCTQNTMLYSEEYMKWLQSVMPNR